MEDKYSDYNKAGEYALMSHSKLFGLRTSSEEFYKHVSDLVVENLENLQNPHGKYLDVGCGVGRIVADIAKPMPDSEVWGTDTSWGMIDLSRQIVSRKDAFSVRGMVSRGYGLHNTKFAQCTAEEVPEKTGIDEFDGVVCMNVFDRVEKPQELLDTLRSLVKDKGSLCLINAFDYEDSTPVDNRIFQKDIDAYLCSGGFVKTHYSERSLVKKIEDIDRTFKERIAFYERRR